MSFVRYLDHGARRNPDAPCLQMGDVRMRYRDVQSLSQTFTAALDLAVERFDEGKGARARFVGISVPMHTALRLGARVAERVREVLTPDAESDCELLRSA